MNWTLSPAVTTYLETLKGRLTPYYTPPATLGGYDLNHILEMVALGPRIAAIPRYSSLNRGEFEVAVWLHNTDRPDKLARMIRKGDEGSDRRWAGYLNEPLEGSPFSREERDRIVSAILEHPKLMDEPDDSVLLTALRIADKVVRFGPLGMMGQPANRGQTQMFYNPEDPFKWASTAERSLTHVINDYFRVLEWYTMLPCDEARSLIDPEDFAVQLAYLRQLGKQISRVTGKRNEIECCIARALGPHYVRFAPAS